MGCHWLVLVVPCLHEVFVQGRSASAPGCPTRCSMVWRRLVQETACLA
jgi:hypothetical protein